MVESVSKYINIEISIFNPMDFYPDDYDDMIMFVTTHIGKHRISRKNIKKIVSNYEMSALQLNSLYFVCRHILHVFDSLTVILINKVENDRIKFITNLVSKISLDDFDFKKVQISDVAFFEIIRGCIVEHLSPYKYLFTRIFSLISKIDLDDNDYEEIGQYLTSFDLFNFCNNNERMIVFSDYMTQKIIDENNGLIEDQPCEFDLIDQFDSTELVEFNDDEETSIDINYLTVDKYLKLINLKKGDPCGLFECFANYINVDQLIGMIIYIFANEQNKIGLVNLSDDPTLTLKHCYDIYQIAADESEKIPTYDIFVSSAQILNNIVKPYPTELILKIISRLLNLKIILYNSTSDVELIDNTNENNFSIIKILNNGNSTDSDRQNDDPIGSERLSNDYKYYLLTTY